MEDAEDDHVDMAELEANLYAQIHHDAPDTVEQFSAAQKLQQRELTNAPSIPNRVVTNKTIVNNNSSVVAALDGGQKRGRYWANGAGQPAAPFAKTTQFSKPWNPNLSDRSNDADRPSLSAAPLSVQEPSAIADYRPKPFTPYTSYLSQIGTTPVPSSATTPSSTIIQPLPQANPAPPSGSAADPTIVSRTHEELRAALIKKNRLNRKKKQRQKKREDLGDRRPNPFNRIAENKLQTVAKLKCKQEKANSVSAKLNKQQIETINLDSDSELADDDVICIPVPPPPLVCIESSTDDEDDREEDAEDQDDETEETNAAVVTEDFIGQRDRTRISQCEDALGGLGDEELAFICATVEKAHIENLESRSPTYAPRSTSPTNTNSDDRILLNTPKRPSSANLSYEVSENGFAAVDIYESESSDFPESVYERGKPKDKLPAGETLIDSDSDVSDIEVNIANRSKRRSKRKSSGSNKGSDYRTCSEDEDEMDDSDDDAAGPAFVQPMPSTSTPCVQRGDAVALSKSKLIRGPSTTPKRKKRNKSLSEHPSDDEFVSMLSCIVHDDLNSTNDSSAEPLSQDVIGARTIVEQTLKKSNRLNSTDGVVVNTKTAAKWVVTDEPVGHQQVEPESDPVGTIDHADDHEFMIVDSVGESDPLPRSMGELTRREFTVADDCTVAVRGNDLNDETECVPSCSLVVDNPELCWNDEMRSFYNKSWGGERHNQSATIRGMTNNPNDWSICDDDLFPSTPQTSRRFNARNLRCNNCREKGHRAQDCYQPPKPVRCHMCGEGGHREPRCPNTICLRCGFKTNVFSRGCQRCLAMAGMQCHQCKARGHGIKDCPDKWRRYHSTTKPNVPPKSVSAISKTKYCCVCASAGHLAEYCRHALRIMDNPAQPIKIQSYTETYQRLDATEIKADGSQLDAVAPFALVSVPVKHYNFAWDVKEQPQRFYGRMMRATQLQRTQFKVASKKRKISELESGARLTKSARKLKHSNKDGKDMVLNPMSFIQKKSVRNEIVEVAEDNTLDDSNNHESIQEEVVEEGSLSQDVEMDTNPLIIDEIETEVDNLEENTECAVVDNIQSENPPDDHSTSDDLHTSIDPTISEIAQISINSETDPPAGSITDSIDNINAEGLINFSFTSALEEIEQEKQSSKNSFELSFFQNTSTEDPAAVAHGDMNDRPATPPPPNISFAALSEHETHEICAEMHRLEKQEEMLNQLKNTIISSQRTNRVPERVSVGSEDAVGYHVELTEDFEAAAAMAADNAHDSDSNYSFSDFFAKHQESTQPKKTPAPVHADVTFEEAARMPDFIPLGQDDDDLDIIVTQDHAESRAEKAKESNDDNPSKYSEAKIYLTKDHSKYLLTRNGGTFLTETYTKHNVIVRMEWRSIGNVLVVQGKPSAQDNFHADLMAYCTSAEEEMRKKQEISQQVPKNRTTLIRFLKEQISQLEKPLAFAKEVFVRMKINEQQRSKTGAKNADKARKTLNMILFGQTGLRDGAMHLTALQSNLRCLIENETKDVISNVFRNEVFQHYKYIFSSFSHDNYADLVREYEKLRKNKQLPVLKLDRKLLGLKINVSPVICVDPIQITIKTDALTEITQRNVATTSAANRADTSQPSANLPLVVRQVPLPVVAPAKQQSTAKLSTPTTTAVASIKPESMQASDLVNICELGAAPQRNTPYVRSADAMPSKIWSLKCSEYIQKCRAIPKISNNEKAMARLQQVDVKAKNGALSYTDFRMLMRIFDKCV